MYSPLPNSPVSDQRGHAQPRAYDVGDPVYFVDDTGGEDWYIVTRINMLTTVSKLAWLHIMSVHPYFPHVAVCLDLLLLSVDLSFRQFSSVSDLCFYDTCLSSFVPLTRCSDVVLNLSRSPLYCLSMINICHGLCQYGSFG